MGEVGSPQVLTSTTAFDDVRLAAMLAMQAGKVPPYTTTSPWTTLRGAALCTAPHTPPSTSANADISKVPQISSVQYFNRVTTVTRLYMNWGT
jgi:hypothetical protein